MNCQGYGSCDPATCQPFWVETHRSSLFNVYLKSFWYYHELWADQYIVQQEVACGHGTRIVCDTLLIDRCHNTSATGCCLGCGHGSSC
jgi:hypothetical protein